MKKNIEKLKRKHPKTVPVTLRITIEESKFLKKHDLSPRACLQSKIKVLIEELK